MSEGINQAHFELDFIDDKYPFDADSGVASFLADLARPAIRNRLASELFTDLPKWRQTEASATVAQRTDDSCEIDAGAYERNGETATLGFSRSHNRGQVYLTWDGSPGNDLDPLFFTNFGDDGWPMIGGSTGHKVIADVQLENAVNPHILKPIMHSRSITIDGGNFTEPINLPAGDLYKTGLALQKCFDTLPEWHPAPDLFLSAIGRE